MADRPPHLAQSSFCFEQSSILPVALCQSYFGNIIGHVPHQSDKVAHTLVSAITYLSILATLLFC